ncbi:MAG: hypothetical protein Q8M76_02105, partial [Spirochaetaceae bacterium]|nr:hypothetical protein [Spirochaetaceae bacterium]
GVAMARSEFELILLAIERDLAVLATGLPYIRRFLKPGKVTLIASAPCLAKARAMGLASGISDFLDEDLAVQGLSLAGVRGLIEDRGGDPNRAGWYFKQIVIFCYSLRETTAERYLAWDADTIPVRPIAFFDEAGRVLYAKKKEHNQAYFATIRRLLDLEKQGDFSFIAEHMMFDRGNVRELLAAIQGGRAIDAGKIAERIIAAVDPKDLPGSGFSEYETYGTYVSARMPGTIVARDLPSSRHGTAFFGRRPSPAQLFAVSTRYHWASFEAWRTRGAAAYAKLFVRRLAGALWTCAAVISDPKGYARFREEVTSR